jgi:hypothetical protein
MAKVCLNVRASPPAALMTLWKEGKNASRRVQFLRDVLTTDPDFTLVLPGGGEVVGELHSQPRFGRAAECLG